MFYELRDIFRQLATPETFKESVKGDQSFSFGAPITDVRELFHLGNDRDLTIELRIPQIDQDQEHVTNVLIRIRHNTNIFRISLPIVGDLGSPHDIGLRSGTELFFKRLAKITGQASDHRCNIKMPCEAMRILSRCVYIGAFRNAINIGTKEDYFDIEVGESFVRRWSQYKSGGDVEHAALAIRVTNEIAQVFGMRQLEINPTDDRSSLQVIRDGAPFKLAELGAGIAQFAIVLANVAIKHPSLVLIDEPELNLHPSLQLDFLTAIASYASDGVLFSTHNIGLARASGDRIYSVRISEGRSEVRELEKTNNLPEFLGEISFSGYRDLGFEKILLVEGPTEVKAIQQFLRLFGKDHTVVLLSLGGSSMINGHSQAELEEIKRICPKVVALVDSERESESATLSADRSGFKAKCDESKIDCHITERRAIENYFTDAAVKEAFGKNYAALAAFDALFDALNVAPNGWSKRENWRVARAMSKTDLDGTDLGEFLAKL
jgi:energy-coupling factor transporter ATP-binding protein EcfA2